MNRAATILILVIVIAAGIGTYYAFKNDRLNGDLGINATSTDTGTTTDSSNIGVGTTTIGAPSAGSSIGGTTATPTPRSTVTATRRATPSPSPYSICQTDVRICSDGSRVSRVAPSCQFAACPAPVSSNNYSSNISSNNSGSNRTGANRTQSIGAPNTGGTRGLVDGWVTERPTCRVNYPPMKSSCAEGLSTTLDVRMRDSGRLVETVSSGSNGKFQLVLSPGIYEIHGRGSANCTVETIEVKIDAVTSPHVICNP